jgi:signal peptidase I
MDLVTIGIIALVVSTPIVVWDLVTANTSRLKEALLPYTQFAYLACFIAGFGLLLKVMSFAAVLLLATATTGLIWLWDRYANKGVAAEAAKAEPQKSVAQAAAAGGVRTEQTKALPQVPIWRELGASFFPVILIVFVVRSFLVEPFRIPSGSMIPTLLVGDFILVNKFAYGVRLPVANKKIFSVGDPQRGDVMVFRYPVDESLDYIKRVIGVPGDTVSYRNKQLTINGEAVTQVQDGAFEYLEQEANFSGAQLEVARLSRFKETLGTHTHATLNETAKPTLHLGSVQSFPNKEQCRYDQEGFTCTVPAGHYFMMGDNRDRSSDSRYWGFVPENHIVGKAFLIWLNWSDIKRIGTRIN